MGEGRLGAFDETTIEPGRAIRLDLIVEGQVGSHRERDALGAARVLKSPQFDNRAGHGVTGRLYIRKAQMVGAAVDAVDDRERFLGQFVGEAARDEPPDQRRTILLAVDLQNRSCFDRCALRSRLGAWS